MTRYSKEVIDTAIGLLDIGMAFATVERVLRERFPEETINLEHSKIITWNKKYRDGKPPMMYMMHFDPMLFVDAVDMIEQGYPLRQISAMMKQKYGISISYGTIGVWGRRYAVRGKQLSDYRHNQDWRNQIRRAIARVAIDRIYKEDDLYTKLHRLNEQKALLELQVELIEERIRKHKQRNDPEELIIAP